MIRPPILETKPDGLWCEAGGFHIDPWRPVPRAVVTHAHSDHARRGCGRYLCATDGVGVLRRRMTPDAAVDALPYGRTLSIGGVRLSFHPAGHLLGSAQVRLECDGEVWVVGGDYKIEPDRTCRPFEPVRCHTFVSESTFGLPIYRWRPQAEVFLRINDWWAANAANGVNSLIFAYSLGKAQRILGGLDPAVGPILLHGAVEEMTVPYREEGIELPATRHADAAAAKETKGAAIVVAPPSANGSPWARKFGPASTAFASGWMQIRGSRRRRAVDRGFVLSDHADWPGLLTAIHETGAEKILVTHGYVATL
ncbi:MAG: ligase-associated DNA damage response exonuclease, partial [Planctomycetia bacterium]